MIRQFIASEKITNDVYRVSLIAAIEDREQLPDRNLNQSLREAKESKVIDTFWRFSWAARAKHVRHWLLWVIAFDLGLIVFDAIIDSSLLWWSLITRGVGLSSILAIVFVIWGRPRAPWIHGLSVSIAAFGIMFVAGVLGTLGGPVLFERYLTAGLFTVATAVMIVPIQLRWTVSAILVALVLKLAFIISVQGGDRSAILIWAFYGAAVFSLLSARSSASNGMWRGFLSRVRDARLRDELARLNDDLRVLASRDALTGLANRRSAKEYLDQVWHQNGLMKNQIAFLMIDIDHFKRLNDTCGHVAGDECIRAVATAISSCLRPSDLVSRHGGEEFLVVIPKSSPKFVGETAENIRAAVEQLAVPNSFNSLVDIVTVSIGVAMALEGATPELVTIWADNALYDAKSSGRNQVRLYEHNNHLPYRAKRGCYATLVPALDTGTAADSINLQEHQMADSQLVS